MDVRRTNSINLDNDFAKDFLQISRKVTLVVDMVEQAEAISKVAQMQGRKVPVLIKLETGVDRYGVPPGQLAVELANKIKALPGVRDAAI